MSRVIPIRGDGDYGPHPMCQTCAHMGGGASCEYCETGEMYEIHPEVEEEFFA